MTTCIQQTIQTIDTKILSLQNLKSELEMLFGDQVISAKKSTPAVRPTHSALSNGQRSERRGDADRIIQIAASMSEPLQITALAIKAGIPKSSAKSSFDRWLNRGWLNKVGYGQYRRTKSFGKDAPASIPDQKPEKKRGPLAILSEASRSEIESKIENACKQRDAARIAGRDTMVDMFQEQIDKLTAQLASV